MCANQQAFGATDGGAIQQDAKVGGKSRPPRVGVALAIAKEKIGKDFELPEGGQQNGNFAKAEQPGDVGKFQGKHGHCAGDLLHFRETINDHTTNRAIRLSKKNAGIRMSPQGLRTGENERRVQTSDGADFAQAIAAFPPGAKFLLDRAGARRRDPPGMEPFGLGRWLVLHS